MNILYNHKNAAGNIALVLILAFLFTMVFSVVGAEQALALTVEVDGKTAADPANPTDLGTYTSLSREIPINFYPVTLLQFESILFSVYNSIGSTIQQDVYVSSIYDRLEVYSTVYTVYAALSSLLGVSAPNDTYTIVFTVDSVLKSVYLSLEVPPPATGGGRAPAAPATVEADSGTVTVDTAADSAELAVSTQAAASIIQKTGSLTLEFPAAVTTSQRVVALPKAVINTVQDNRASIQVKLPDVNINIPAGAFAVPAVTGASENAQVKLTFNTISTTGVADINANIPEAAKRDLTNVARVVQIMIEVVEEGRDGVRVTFAKPVTLVIRYEPAAGVDENKLGVYRLSDDGTSWSYVGGKIDKANKMVSVDLYSFSKYTIMEYNKVFTDTVGHWAQADVELMAARHIARGISDTEFAPNREIKRAEFAALLIRALGISERIPANAEFKDVTRDKWYYGSVEAAAEAGLVLGYEGYFRPEDNINRQEMAAMIVRAMKYDGREVSLTSAQVEQLLSRFKDAKDIHDWAKEAAAVAVDEEIIYGRTADTFVPAANATRAESIVMIKRLFSNLDKL